MADKSKLVLVTGATGHQGGAIARELLDAGWRVRAMTRKPHSDAALELTKLGAEIVAGDLDDEASLQRALAGAWGALAVQNTWEAGVEKEEEQGKRFARVARESGIQHFVYQSVASAQRNTGIPHFDNKWRIEETVRSLGFPSHVIIRPVFFMENLLGNFFKPGIGHGVFEIALNPATPLQMIAVEDIGKYGFLAFENAAEMNGMEVDIAGDELTGPDVARTLTDVLDREIQFKQASIEDVRSMSEDYALMLEWFNAVGYDVDIAKTSAQFKVEPTRFREWAARQEWEVPV